MRGLASFYLCCRSCVLCVADIVLCLFACLLCFALLTFFCFACLLCLCACFALLCCAYFTLCCLVCVAYFACLLFRCRCLFQEKLYRQAQAQLAIAYHNIITHNEIKAKYTELLLSAASAHSVTIFSLSSSPLPPRSSRLTFFKQTFACWVLRAKLSTQERES